MSNPKIMLIVLLLGLFGSLSAQTIVSPYKAGVTAEGITYFLPKTGFYVSLTAQRTTYKPGEYCIFAERYLRLTDVIMEEYDVWELTNIELVPFGEADSTRAYTIALRSKSVAPLVGMTPDGRLLSINRETPEMQDEPLCEKTLVEKAKTDEGELTDYRGRDVLTAGSRAKMAELAAAEIYDIRDNRALLSKGQADFMPKDGEQLKLMLQTLDRQESSLLKLFKGSTTKETHRITLKYLPNGEVDNHVLLRFSKHLGFVDVDDLAGEPIYVGITDLKSLPRVDESDQVKQKKVPLGVRYLLPGRARICISTMDKEWLKTEFPMAQFGRIENLGGDLFNKKTPTSVLLSPINGCIMKIDSLPVDNK